MYLLALESTSTHCGVALWDGSDSVATLQVRHGMNLSGTLVRATEWALQQAQITLEQVDAFAVDVGPGAFTGLKIGVMIAKSWAYALQKPLVAVSAFEACAITMPTDVP
ncbi:MAG: tRNA (adenosine(37)-N6)-threonylcarbamoyltransferase complex dimerization subunit type 1 TsaB, partial [Fimbriimonadales bacterium]